jgi:hypothetical protein
MFKNKLILAYALLALLPVIILPCYVFVYLPPKFNAFIIDDTKTEAIRVANHLASSLIADENNLSNGNIVNQLEDKDAQIRKELPLSKLKLFLPTGEVIYSSSPEDIGKVNPSKPMWSKPMYQSCETAILSVPLKSTTTSRRPESNSTN